MNRHTKHLIAIAAVAATAFAGAASAGTTSQEAWFGAQPATQQSAPLSRTEVQADLNLWNRAGLGSVNAGEYGDVTDTIYAQRMATYQRMRSGPEYVAEVQRLGGSVSTAGAAAQHSAN